MQSLSVVPWNAMVSFVPVTMPKNNLSSFEYLIFARKPLYLASFGICFSILAVLKIDAIMFSSPRCCIFPFLELVTLSRFELLSLP